jgi:hypothetical protein
LAAVTKTGDGDELVALCPQQVPWISAKPGQQGQLDHQL